jgi:hypothetical protein
MIQSSYEPESVDENVLVDGRIVLVEQAQVLDVVQAFELDGVDDCLRHFAELILLVNSAPDFELRIFALLAYRNVK